MTFEEMHQSQVPLLLVVAAGAWVVGGLLVVIGVIANSTTVSMLGLWVTSGAATVTVIRVFASHAVTREKAAFELGRMVGASDNVSRI